MLKVWDWMTGTLKYEVPVLESIEPFVGVKATKRKRGLPEDDGEGGELPEGTKVRRKKGKKGKGKEREGTEEGDGDEKADVEEEAKPEKVLVIHLIESVQTELGLYVVFSAVGFVHLILSLCLL